MGLSLYNKSNAEPLDARESAHAPGAVILDMKQHRVARMRRGVLTGARLLSHQWASVGHLAVMVTLTYAPGVRWRPRHIVEYTNRMRQWSMRRGIPCCYLWVLETTKKGVPHYHVLVWLKRGYRLPKADKQGWWPHGMTRTELARSPVGYMAKYASKGFAHALPRGARVSGVGGLCEGSRRERAWWLLPLYARKEFNPDEAVFRCAGGGFLSRTSGHWIRSEWLCSYLGQGLVRIRPKPVDFLEHAPMLDVVSRSRSVRVDAGICQQPVPDRV